MYDRFGEINKITPSADDVRISLFLSHTQFRMEKQALF